MGPGMGLNLQPRQELSQKQILAPRMIQSMEILQLPALALQERILTEYEENPVLELRQAASDDAAPEADGRDLGDNGNDPADPDRELVIDEKNDYEDFDRLDSINEDWSDHFNEESRPSVNRIEEASERKHLAETNMVARPQSLQDYLEEQLHFLDCSPMQLKLARHLLDYIHKSGYLLRTEVIEKDKKIVAEKTYPVTLEEIADAFEEPVTSEDVADALGLIQSLDPPGVGARDLSECLLLQVTPETPHAEVLRAIIRNHLEDVQHNRLPLIEKKTGFDIGAIREAIEQLRHLDPKPGNRFRAEDTQYVLPDLAVEKNDDGDYEVRMLDDWTPNLYISKRYRHLYRMYRQNRADPALREFLKRKIQAAEWILDAIEQRRNTLLKVTRAIVAHQRAFLEHGPEQIEPLKMQQIADQVGVHVTTVSRAVDDKWVQTPRGVFPLKRFFGGGTQTANGEEVAYEAIKQKLLELIEHEDKSKPLSDEVIVQRLNDAGIPVARRTVTKYRKMLSIPSSRQRKVWA